MNTFAEENFTNNIGQVLQPGERVLALKTSWSSTYADEAIYRGVIKNPEGKVVSLRVENLNPNSWAPHSFSNLRLKRAYALRERI